MVSGIVLCDVVVVCSSVQLSGVRCSVVCGAQWCAVRAFVCCLVNVNSSTQATGDRV